MLWEREDGGCDRGKEGWGMTGSCFGKAGQHPAGAGAEHTPGCVRRVGFARGILLYSRLAKQISSAVNVSLLALFSALLFLLSLLF